MPADTKKREESTAERLCRQLEVAERVGSYMSVRTADMRELLDALLEPKAESAWQPPFNSQSMFQFKVDEARKWVERFVKDTGCGPTEDEFEEAFKSKFGMTWRYWQTLTEKCELYYAGAMNRGAA